jgi:hypothetical protein
VIDRLEERIVLEHILRARIYARFNRSNNSVIIYNNSGFWVFIGIIGVFDGVPQGSRPVKLRTAMPVA